ncbi:MAG: ferrous iron transport protein B [Clostridia bacterium]
MKEFLLLGNPNTGKTTLYNALTHSFEHAGNWHGVTVCEKSKQIAHSSIMLYDLPGLYSLSPLSPEEKITTDRVQSSENIIVVLDANAIYRNLYLAIELLERGKNVILALNFKKENDNYNLFVIEKALGCKIVCIDAYSKKTLKNLTFEMEKFVPSQVYLPYFSQSNIINEISKIVDNSAKKCNLSPFYCAMKIIERDNSMSVLNLTETEQNKIDDLVSGINGKEFVCKIRYDFIQSILISAKKKNVTSSRKSITQKIDKFMLNPFLALSTFLIMMFIVFTFAFGYVGNYLSFFVSRITYVILGEGLLGFISTFIHTPWILALFSNAILGGVMAVLSFLPQVVILACGIKMLEDIGILSRIALILDPFFKKIGLSGRSVFSLLVGFGCNTTAIMVTRNIENDKIRKRTMFILPFISCSACVPIILLITGAFFLKGQVFILFSLYLVSLLIALFILALISKISKIKDEGFILELPLYRIPKFRKFISSFFLESKKYISRTLTTILGFSIILFILSSFNFRFELDSEGSMLNHVTGFISIIFKPIGLGNPHIVMALIMGILAKEMIVSSLAMSNGITSDNIPKSLGISLVSASSLVFFTPITAIVFMLFVVLYSPCISTLKMIRREGSLLIMILCLLTHLIVSYLVCFIAYRLLLLLSYQKYLTAFLSLIILAFSIIFVLKCSKKQKCANCMHSSCVNSCKTNSLKKNFHKN